MDDIDFNSMNNVLPEDDLNSSSLREESSLQQDSEQELGSPIFSPYVVDHTNTYMLYLYHVVLVMTDSGCVSFHLCGSSCNSSSYDAFV